jgi:phenylalanyl-tRNA synthetase alpha chain
MQDTFYTSNNRVLRTHTTSVQARQLKEAVNLLKDGALREGASIKIASIGKAYRNEAEDATHQSMFHQFELVWVDVGLTLADLMGLIEFIVKELFGRRRKIRFIPKFYPYTEPSIGVAVSHRSDDTWQTVAGAGMIHRKVLDEFGFTSPKITGLAFGFGMERLAMQYYGYSDIRSLYENDLRRLRSNR